MEVKEERWDDKDDAVECSGEAKKKRITSLTTNYNNTKDYNIRTTTSHYGLVPDLEK